MPRQKTFQIGQRVWAIQSLPPVPPAPPAAAPMVVIGGTARSVRVTSEEHWREAITHPAGLGALPASAQATGAPAAFLPRGTDPALDAEVEAANQALAEAHALYAAAIQRATALLERHARPA